VHRDAGSIRTRAPPRLGNVPALRVRQSGQWNTGMTVGCAPHPGIPIPRA
jgi:hypothetical protein